MKKRKRRPRGGTHLRHGLLKKAQTDQSETAASVPSCCGKNVLDSGLSS